MSSYQPLADYLAGKKSNIWDATFDEIEDKLGRPLPRSAYRHQAWWANQSGPGHSQTQGWRSVGWRTAKLDLERRRVRFEREQREGVQPSRASNRVSRVDAVLLERAMAVSGIDDPDAVIAAALRDYIAREAARGLIELGGSAPAFQAAPRERPWA